MNPTREDMYSRIMARAQVDELQKLAGVKDRIGAAWKGGKSFASRHRGKVGLAGGLAVGAGAGAVGGYKLEQNRLSPKEARFTASVARRAHTAGRAQQFAALPADVRVKLMKAKAKPISDAPPALQRHAAALRAKGGKFIRNPSTGQVYSL